MLRNWSPYSGCQKALVALLILMLGFGVLISPLSARAEDTKPRFVLLLDPPADTGGFRDRDYSYRKVNRERTISLMLYGFNDQQPAAPEIGNTILKDKKSLGAFFHKHLNDLKRDYSGNETGSMRLVAGETSFTSTQMNRGQNYEPAKMAGVTLPFGKVTVGGGYSWGEKNPAYMMPTADGLFVGASYDTGNTGFQMSYLTSGQRVVGFKVGGTSIRYSSLMLGTSFRINHRMSLTATAQYRSDNDPATTGDRQGIFTVGTRWQF